MTQHLHFSVKQYKIKEDSVPLLNDLLERPEHSSSLGLLLKALVSSVFDGLLVVSTISTGSIDVISVLFFW